MLAEKAYPDLKDDAREQLALNQYLARLDNPQVVFAVKQGKPKTINDAIRLTLETESYLQLPMKQTVVHIASCAFSDIAKADRSSGKPKSKSRCKPFKCWNCGGEGHAAKDCASPKKQADARKQGNEKPSVQ